jgi:hypothetical protein
MPQLPHFCLYQKMSEFKIPLKLKIRGTFFSNNFLVRSQLSTLRRFRRYSLCTHCAWNSYTAVHINPASVPVHMYWAKVRKVYKDRKWFRGRLDCFFFSSDSESLYASTREQHGVGWGSVAGLTENKTKPTCLSPIFVL